MNVSITEVATTMRTRLDAGPDWGGDDIQAANGRQSVVRIVIRTQQGFEVFDAAQHQHHGGAQQSTREEKLQQTNCNCNQKFHGAVYVIRSLPPATSGGGAEKSL